MHKVQAKNTVSRWCISSTPSDMGPESAPLRSFENTHQSNRRSAVFNRVLLIMKQPESDTDWYAKNVVKLGHCNNFDIESIRNRSKSPIS